DRRDDAGPHPAGPRAVPRRPLVAGGGQGPAGPGAAAGPDALHHLVRAPAGRLHAAPQGTEHERPVRPPAVPRGRHEADVQGGLHPEGGRQGRLHAGPLRDRRPGHHGLRGHPGRRRGADPLHRHHDPAAGHRPARLGAVHRGRGLDRRLRHRAGRLVVGLHLRAARRPALQRPGDQLRGGDGSGARRGLPLRGLAVHVGDRGQAGRAGRHHPRPGPAGLVRRAAHPVVPHLPHRHGGGDQPRAVRPPRGRGRAGGRLPHRVLLDAVRHVLHGRVHEHDHGVRPGHDAVPRRLARAAAVQPHPRGRRRLVGPALVPGQGRARAVGLRVAARHPAEAPLRPVHAVRVEVADPDLAGLDPARRHLPRRPPRRLVRHPGLLGGRRRRLRRPARRVVLRRGQGPASSGRAGDRGVRRLRRRLPGAADGRPGAARAGPGPARGRRRTARTRTREGRGL
ncbi:MAG: NADH-ubiquinone oxidoreductase chain H, partial [uncultured Friedmanniella sp.]